MAFKKTTKNLLELNVNEIVEGFSDDIEINDDELYFVGEQPNVLMSKKEIDKRPMIYSGTEIPSNDFGKIGDIFILYDE